MSERAVFHDLPEDAFPFEIAAYGERSGRCVWHEEVKDPCVQYIPPLKEIHGEPVTIVTRYASGELAIVKSDGTSVVRTPK